MYIINIMAQKNNKPSAQFCTDNAAMIAFVGSYKAKHHEFSTLDLDIFQ
ncbi:MAG TPA: hypothetical protein VGW78_00585 [Candidatus Babeliales bacterium]|nr:hypothetical protein [Candidatus Babeliales bacterium]